MVVSFRIWNQQNSPPNNSVKITPIVSNKMNYQKPDANVCRNNFFMKSMDESVEDIDSVIVPNSEIPVDIDPLETINSNVYVGELPFSNGFLKCFLPYENKRKVYISLTEHSSTYHLLDTNNDFISKRSYDVDDLFQNDHLCKNYVLGIKSTYPTHNYKISLTLLNPLISDKINIVSYYHV